jgi:hypothetical protein
VAAVGLEYLTVASGTRAALGDTNNFEMLSFMGKLLAVTIIISIVGLIRSQLGRSEKSAAHDDI